MEILVLVQQHENTAGCESMVSMDCDKCKVRMDRYRSLVITYAHTRELTYGCLCVNNAAPVSHLFPSGDLCLDLASFVCLVHTHTHKYTQTHTDWLRLRWTTPMNTRSRSIECLFTTLVLLHVISLLFVSITTCGPLFDLADGIYCRLQSGTLNFWYIWMYWVQPIVSTIVYVFGHHYLILVSL